MARAGGCDIVGIGIGLMAAGFTLVNLTMFSLIFHVLTVAQSLPIFAVALTFTVGGLVIELWWMKKGYI